MRREYVLGLLFALLLTGQVDAAPPSSDNGFCYERSDWKDISNGEQAFNIASGQQEGAVWIITSHALADGLYALAKFDPSQNKFVRDADQPVGAIYEFAVDSQGNPAFIDATRKLIHWKKEGTWTTVEQDCVWGLSFGGDGSFFKRDCSNDVHKWDEEKGGWSIMGGKKAYAIAADRNGTPWVITNTNEVSKWNSEENKWEDIGLSQVTYLAVGSEDQVYALAKPRFDMDETIYQYKDNNWTPLQGQTAEEIAIGANGDLYVTRQDNSVITSSADGQKMRPCTIPASANAANGGSKGAERAARQRSPTRGGDETSLFRQCLADAYCKKMFEQKQTPLTPEETEELIKKQEKMKEMKEELDKKTRELDNVQKEQENGEAGLSDKVKDVVKKQTDALIKRLQRQKEQEELAKWRNPCNANRASRCSNTCKMQTIGKLKQDKSALIHTLKRKAVQVSKCKKYKVINKQQQTVLKRIKAKNIVEIAKCKGRQRFMKKIGQIQRPPKQKTVPEPSSLPKVDTGRCHWNYCNIGGCDQAGCKVEVVCNNRN